MDQIIYYTFSTIPQVTIGAMTLLGAFIVFRNQATKSEILGEAKALKKEIETNESYRKDILKYSDNKRIIRRFEKSIEKGNLKELLCQIQEIVISAPTESTENFLLKFKNKIQFFEKSTSQAKTAFIFNIVLILVSILIIPSGHILCDSSINIVIALVISGTTLTGIGIALVLRYIFKALN